MEFGELMKRLVKYILLSIVLIGCGRIETIGLKDHSFSKQPKRVIWMQVAGLSSEHLAMLRFNLSNANIVTPMEKAQCVGQMWSYNLYSLRPPVNKSFQSQIFGTPDLKNKCDPLKKEPVWKLYADAGYKPVILENLVSEKDSINALSDCDGKEKLGLNETTSLYKMSKRKSKENRTFHYQEELDTGKGVFYDKACSSGECISSLQVNVKKIWNSLKDNNNRSFFLIRDFKYLEALKRRDIELAKERLLEVAKIYELFLDFSRNSKDTLVLLTTSNSLNFEFPKDGKKWAEFEKSGKNVLFRNTSLLSQSYANGPASENFCGFYSESEVFKRMIWRSKEKNLTLDSIKKLF